ncbi:thiolase family protein [Pseudonocardia ailaonensis]|uniref:Thiolase family protein n=1 Tax=Pseudonocardia ailaonensis TaxID=367279 RepID=A0ABN2N9G5_9PSEU
MLNDDPVAIVGLDIPRLANHIPDENSFSLCLKAVLGAIDDAGLSRDEVNGACLTWESQAGSPMSGSSNWARLLGSTLNWVAENDLDALGIRGVLNAAAAIKAGLCETVVIGAALAGGPAVHGAHRMSRIVSASDEEFPPALLEFSHPFGAGGIPHRSALNARRHMYDFGTRPEHLAEVAATIRNHGHENPEAVMFGRGPYDIDQIMNSRWIAEPLHLLECGMAGQAGAAIVITSGDRARRLVRNPVYVLAGAMEIVDGAHANPALNRDVAMLGAERMAVAFAQAGIKPAELDVLSLHDVTAFEVIRYVEMLGLCEQGEGGPFVEGGALGLRGGRFPTNTDGGMLSHGYGGPASMILKIIEAVRQLSGRAGERQVAGARTAVVTNSMPAGQHLECMILGAG